MENKMMESQQLMTQDEEQENVGALSGSGAPGGGGTGTHTHSLSPALSSSIHSNRAVQPTPPHGNTTRIAYVSERRPHRINRRVGATFQINSGGNTTSSSIYTSRQDAKQTQADLLRLLAEFSSPEVSKATQQLADIRQQQDDLARLHFKLGSDPDAPSKPASARETMSRLVTSLELLSTSIEQLRNVSEAKMSKATSNTDSSS